MARLRDVVTVSDERIPWYLMGFGVAVGFVVLAEVVLSLVFGVRDLSDDSFVVGTLTSLPFLFGITYGAYWLVDSELSPRRYARIALWCVGGLCAFFLMNAALVASMPPGSWAEAFSWLRWSVAIGAGVGLLVGAIEGRAIHRETRVERATTRSRHLEEQRDMLDYLNSILRHEILNTATAIDGYASRLLEEESSLDEDSEEWLAIIMDETEDMASVIDDVRVLLHRTSGDHQLERVNVGRVVADEVRELRTERESVCVETDVPDDVVVWADDTLPRVFGNLLSNAIEHNDAATPRVTVTAEVTPEFVRVEVADNGPGIPDDELDTLFERDKRTGSRHGLGLYLVAELLETYGGSIELTETGPTGSRFTVELQRAAAEQGVAPEQSAA